MTFAFSIDLKNVLYISRFAPQSLKQQGFCLHAEIAGAIDDNKDTICQAQGGSHFCKEGEVFGRVDHVGWEAYAIRAEWNGILGPCLRERHICKSDGHTLQLFMLPCVCMAGFISSIERSHGLIKVRREYPLK
jgi:hypothetical protein